MRIRVRPETQLEMKNNEFERLHRRHEAYHDALVDDLNYLTIDGATGEEEADTKLTADVNILISRAEAEREEFGAWMNQIYRESLPTDTLALNQVRARRQDSLIQWQIDVEKLPKARSSQTIDRNTRRPLALGSVRAILPRRQDLVGAFDPPNFAPSSVSEADEVITTRKVRGDSILSSASEASESESAAVVGHLKETMSQQRRSPLAEDNDPISKTKVKSDPESDSTIGAGREEDASGSVPLALSPTKVSFLDRIILIHSKEIQNESRDDAEVPSPRISRLPRRQIDNSNVKELVRKYSDYLPAMGMQDLANTALSPRLLSESEQEQPASYVSRSAFRHKSKNHHVPMTKKGSTSDFESSYAANVAPRYLSRPRRSQGVPYYTSRIPGPILSATESHNSSRRTSPDKRVASGRFDGVSRFAPGSPPMGESEGMGTHATKRIRSRAGPPGKERSSGRPSTMTTQKSYRKPSGPGAKVSNIAKHFERLGRENEKASRRYSVIRGKRVRPVATARAKVEVLDSVMDAIKDESESSDSSSEADDEGDGNDEGRRPTDNSQLQEVSLDNSLVQPQTTGVPITESPDQSLTLEGFPKEPEIASMPPDQSERETGGAATSVLSTSQDLPEAPSHQSSQDAEAERESNQSNSILKTIGLWLQPQEPQVHIRSDLDADDPDPEHIFRESSMIVRTDEPTSMIALALK